jgi:hypothetical protein
MKAGDSLDRRWRKSRIAARILMRKLEGPLSRRDVRIGRMLVQDAVVTSRLIEQALYGFSGRQYRLAMRAAIALQTTARDQLI